MSLFFAADSVRAARFARLTGLLFGRLLFMDQFLSASAVVSNCRRSPMRLPGTIVALKVCNFGRSVYAHPLWARHARLAAP